MKIETTSFNGLLICQPHVISDERGAFSESFRQDVLENYVGKISFVQDNESISALGVLRGLHYQVPPKAQAKLVRVPIGKVLDVVVDLRRSEPTFGEHFSIVLSGENKLQLFIPEGFAHGFYVLEHNTIFSYKCSEYYSKESDRSLLWNDPVLNIEWGISDPIVSQKDGQAPRFNETELPF